VIVDVMVVDAVGMGVCVSVRVGVAVGVGDGELVAISIPGGETIICSGWLFVTQPEISDEAIKRRIRDDLIGCVAAQSGSSIMVSL
jgi:hypothetical protein